MLATSRWARQIDPMGGDHRERLSDRGRQLAALAELQMGEMPLKIHPLPPDLLRQNGVTRRRRFPELDPPEYVEVSLKIDDNYEENGRGDPDYYLAHELGHAIRIATSAEPDELRRVNEVIYTLKSGDERQQYQRKQPCEIRLLIYKEEAIAWDIAEELLSELDHDPDRLSELREKSLKSYRDGLGIA